MEPLVDAATLESLASQARLFRVVDALLTGLVISGGSEGLHKVKKVWDNAMAKLSGEGKRGQRALSI